MVKLSPVLETLITVFSGLEGSEHLISEHEAAVPLHWPFGIQVLSSSPVKITNYKLQVASYKLKVTSLEFFHLNNF